MKPNLLLHRRINSSVLQLMVSDITLQEVDAIVTAANCQLVGGGGVDAAVHRVGGPSILAECRAIGRCETGQAVATSAGQLPAKWVFHAVGPVWSGGNDKEDELLASAYRWSLNLAEAKGAKTIAFPSISTGTYGFPVERAANIAVSTVVDFLKTHDTVEEVRLVLFSDADGKIYDDVARKLIDGELLGCYWDFFQNPEKYYLSFLNFNIHASSSEAVRALKSVAEDDAWEKDSFHLLEDPDWRSHLSVAVSFYFFGGCRKSFLDPLWRTVEKGSWVSPQLMVVLSQCDSEFAARLEQLVARGVQPNSTGSPLADHVSMGPGNELSRLGKIAAACRGLQELGVISLPESLREKLRILAEYDFDRADEIAKSWYRKVSELKSYLEKGFDFESDD